MTLFRYGWDEGTINLKVGDLVVIRYNQGKYLERPTFGKVYRITAHKRAIPHTIYLDPSYRLYVNEEFGGQGIPGCNRSVSRPALYRSQHIEEIWTGTPKKLADVLRKEWNNMEPWAMIIERMKEPYNLEVLVEQKHLS